MAILMLNVWPKVVMNNPGFDWDGSIVHNSSFSNALLSLGLIHRVAADIARNWSNNFHHKLSLVGFCKQSQAVLLNDIGTVFEHYWNG